MFSDTISLSDSYLVEQDFRRLYWFSFVMTAAGLLTRRTNRLRSLAAMTQQRPVRHRHTAGRQTIAIRDIRGSEDRSQDFDAAFRPRQWHICRRWCQMLAARLNGVAMPPVELVQVDDTYFVRDGHHRISTAKFLGQQEIEAEVTVWECGPEVVPQPSVSGGIWKRTLNPTASA